MEWFLYLLAGVGIGLFAGFFGVGGGTLTVPLLTALFTPVADGTGIAVKIAVATSLVVATVSSSAATWRNRALLNAQWKAAGSIAAGSIPGAFAGATLALILPGDWLAMALGIILAGVAIQYLADPHEKPEHRAWLHPRGLYLSGLGFLIGLFAGLTGLGGGVVMIPVLVVVFGYPAKMAAMVSSAVIIPTALAAVIRYAGAPEPVLPGHLIQLGLISVTAGIPLSVGALAGGLLGARFLHGTPTHHWKRAFAVLLLLVSADLFWFQ